MYDLIRTRGVKPEQFSFSKLYFLDDVRGKIILASDLSEAVKHRNRKVLVVPGEYKEDIGLMKQFGGGQAAFLIDLGRIIENSGYKRALEMSRIKRFLRTCVKFSIPFALASLAKDEFSVRSSDELCNIAALVGLNAGQAKFALERLGEYLG